MVISRETQRGIFRFLISARRKVACKRLVISINFKASLLLFFSSRRRHTIYWLDWSSDVCSSDLPPGEPPPRPAGELRDAPAAHVVTRAAERDQVAPRTSSLRLAAGVPRAVVRDRAVGGAVQQQKRDRKSVVEGKSVELGGRRIIK